MKFVRLVCALAVYILIGLPTTTPRITQAATALQIAPTPKLIELRADPTVSSVRIPAPRQFTASRAPTMVVNVNYSPTPRWGDTCGTWPAQAQTAFSYAANIWGSLLTSSVPLTIDACWAGNLPNGVLGHGGALSIVSSSTFSGAPYPNTYYVVALANALAGSDRNGSTAEIYLALSSTFSWHYDPYSTPAGSTYDLATVALHEIGHGLGFLGSMDWDNGNSADGVECNNVYNNGCWGYSGLPDVYDQFTRDLNDNRLINVGIYGNPSTMLGNALRSTAVYFNGANANAANGGSRVKLYAPSAWAPGSSYAHLDEIYNNTQNALMTYSLSYREVVHDPGPVTLGIMKDIGWSVVPASPSTPVPVFLPLIIRQAN